VEGVREKVWKKSSFRVFYIFNIAEQTQGCTISHTSNHSIKTDGSKLIHKWLHADPVVTHEHHGFFAIFMDNVYHLLCKLCNLAALECLEVLEFLGWNAVGIVHVALVDNVFRAEWIADLFFELLQHIWTDRCGITEPVHIFLPCQLIKDQGELMEKGGEAYHIHILVGIKESAEALQGMSSCFWLAHIKGDLRLYIFPVVYHCIVHMYRIPHNISQEADGILMERFYRCNYHISARFIIMPLTCRNHCSCGTVDYFPPLCDIIACVHLQHIRVQVVHKVDLQFV